MRVPAGVDSPVVRTEGHRVDTGARQVVGAVADRVIDTADKVAGKGNALLGGLFSKVRTACLHGFGVFDLF